MSKVATNSTQTSLTREQKQAVGLLSLGTLLEYFDLMLYVHMAVFLNELFFPKSDPNTTTLYSAIAFCSTFVFRPIGALIFGYIGDKYGRKSTVIITTGLMSISCIVMANLPTYEQIGIAAAWIITICRMVQGMSSVGEIIGAEVYLMEMIPGRRQYPVVAFIAVASVIGTTFALALASVVISFGVNWRSAFWIGAIIAVIGAVARTALRETPEFLYAQKNITKQYKNLDLDTSTLNSHPVFTSKVNKLSIIYMFIVSCPWPVCFYYAYIYCGNVMKNKLGYSSEELIQQNFYVSIFHFIALCFQTFLCSKVHPLKI